MNKINILFQSSYEHARMGGQKSLLALIDNLDRDVFVPFLTVPYEGELKEIAIEKGIKVLVQPLPGIKPANFFRLKKIRDRFVDYVKENNISIIHTDSDKFAYFATFIARKAKIKVVFHARVAQSYKYDKLIESRIDRIVGISEATKYRFKESIVEKKFSVIYNGVDCDLFSDIYEKSEVQAKLGMSSENLNMLFVGQIKEGKGLSEIIEAAKKLKDLANKKYKFYILGLESDEGNLESFESKILEYGLIDYFVFKGQQENVNEWLQASDLLLFPSHEGVEGMGRVPFEAMATGTPVIASDISGVNESVTDKVGILIEEKNPSALANSIELLMSDKALYNNLSRNGRRRALEFFDIKIHAVNMMNLFQEMVKEK